jgi:ribosomal protein S4E
MLNVASVPLASIAIQYLFVHFREREAQKIIHSSETLERAMGQSRSKKKYNKY